MGFSRTQMAIAAGAGVLLLLLFFGYLLWLNNQGPVLARSEERDPLSGIPDSISLNPLRDRASEREAEKFIRAMSEGHRSEEHTSELQSPCNLVCRLLLEKKKKIKKDKYKTRISKSLIIFD